MQQNAACFSFETLMLYKPAIAYFTILGLPIHVGRVT